MNSYKFAVQIFLVSQILQCVALNYDTSKSYLYLYQTDVLFNDVGDQNPGRPHKEVGVKIDIHFTLSSLFKSSDVTFFRLEVTEAKMTSASRPDLSRQLSLVLARPAYFQMTGSTVGNLYFRSDESTFSRNLKKGLVSLFQMSEEEGQRTEVDVSGECDVKYTMPKHGQVDKTKQVCRNLEVADQFSTSNKALGISVYTNSVQKYQLADSVIQKLEGVQRVISYLNIRPSLNGGVSSQQILNLESTTTSTFTQSSSLEEAVAYATKETGSQLIISLLPSEEEVQECTKGCQSPKDLIAKLKDDLAADKLASLESARAFLQLLKSFRNSGKLTVADVLTSPDSYYIVPQLIDIATATQTEAAKEALMELLDFEQEDSVDHPMRFLFAAAYSSHPFASLISDLLAILQKPIPSDSLQDSLLLSLGALIHTFCQIREQRVQPIVEEYKTFVMDKLAACQEEPCKLMYLRSLGNAGLSSTLPIILSYAESKSSSMLSTTAISAMRRIHPRFITNQVKEALLRIYHQNKANYDSSVRGVALEVLLEHQLSLQSVRNLLLSCVDQKNAEFSTYILRMLMDTAKVNPVLREQMLSISKEPWINNYNVHSQKGKSSVITSFLARMKDVNATYNLYFENSPSGVMKRSGMVVNLRSKMFKQPFMKFGIYAEGLETLVGESGSSDEEGSSEGPEPTAGMSFTLMDVLLTQVEFFRGTSGLMSAVWSAPSELMSALQGNLLLQDHSQRIHLANGLVIDSKVLGALSFDLSGYVSISLWNRNSESLIRNSGAYVVEGRLSIDTKEFDLGMTFSGEGASNIDYTSNADFYEMPLKMCMQMKRPDFDFGRQTEKFEHIKKSKRLRRKTKGKLFGPGESYLLNKANSDECRVMNPE